MKDVGEILQKYGVWLLKGVGNTMLIALTGTVVGLLIGLLIGVFRTMPKPKNKALAALKKTGDVLLSAYIEIFRGTPMMVQAMVIYWGFAMLNNGVTLDVTLSAFIIVSVNTGAYMAEIVRGGILSVDKGQFEGAQAIGLTHGKTMRYVILPQTLRNILPSVSNEFVINIKDTSVLNVIGFSELYFQAMTIYADNYKVFTDFLIVAVVYFLLTFAVTRLLRLAEKALGGKSSFRMIGSQNPDAETYVRQNPTEG